MDIAAVAIGENPLPSFVVLEQHEGEKPGGEAGKHDKVEEPAGNPAGSGGLTAGTLGSAAHDIGGADTKSARNLEDEPAVTPVPEEPARRNKPRLLPIRIGATEAAAISRGVDAKKTRRPKTHDLFKATIQALDAELLCARITKVSGTTFYAQLVLRAQDGSEVCVDARPSDAIALAVRFGVNVLASEDVLEAASMLDFSEVEQAVKAAELADFHKFVENVSPEDFKEAE